MGWAEEIARLRRELEKQIETIPSRLIGWTRTSHSSSLGDGDAVQTGDEPDTTGTIRQRPVRRVEPWGLRTRPPSALRALWLLLGSSNVAALGYAPTKAYGPSGLSEGETCLYNSVGGVQIYLAQDGTITITDSNGDAIVLDAAGHIKLNADTLAGHLIAQKPAGGSPGGIIVAAGAALAGGTASLIGGHDAFFQLQLNVGGVSDGIVGLAATVTLEAIYANPVFQATQANSTAWKTVTPATGTPAIQCVAAGQTLQIYFGQIAVKSQQIVLGVSGGGY